LLKNLTDTVETAIESKLGTSLPGIVVPSTRPEFGDYQVNGMMGAAKTLKQNPRVLATSVAEEISNHESIAQAEVAGPGFINLTVSDEFLAQSVNTRPNFTPWGEGVKIVIDYSSPNLAKQLHVGHLRSTVIGDAMVRSFEMAGYHVIRQNHVGDWGTGFGKLLAYIQEIDQTGSFQVDQLDEINVRATERFNSDSAFADRARQIVTQLQGNDVATQEQWRNFMKVSQDHMQEIYGALGVTLKPEHTRGESAYNDDLPNVISDLEDTGLLTISDGAKCVFLDQFKGKDGETLPMLVQKSDGGYLYHTTDLATLRYRQSSYQPDRILYFTDARQNLHFEMLFAVARAASFVNETTQLEHHAFGKILGKNGRPFSTRDGSNIPLVQLLSEGERRARAVVDEKSADLPDQQREIVGRLLSVNSIKYADLSKNRVNDYVFDWDSMLALDGNTAPYLLYAYARLNSIFARGGIDRGDLDSSVQVTEPQEHDLVMRLLRFQETLELVIKEAKPHFLCNYLYELTVHFMRFYESCPILKAEQQVRDSRLSLCAKVAETLENGFECLGITPLQRM